MGMDANSWFQLANFAVQTTTQVISACTNKNNNVGYNYDNYTGKHLTPEDVANLNRANGVHLTAAQWEARGFTHSTDARNNNRYNWQSTNGSGISSQMAFKNNIANTIGSLASAGLQIGSAVYSGNGGGGGVSASGGMSEAATTAINNMKNAETSMDLKNAIDAANATLTERNAVAGKAEKNASDIKNAETNIENSNSNIKKQEGIKNDATVAISNYRAQVLELTSKMNAEGISDEQKAEFKKQIDEINNKSIPEEEQKIKDAEAAITKENEALEQHKQALKILQEEQKDIEKAKVDIKKLTAEIAKQNERLQKLQAQEDKQIERYENKRDRQDRIAAWEARQGWSNMALRHTNRAGIFNNRVQDITNRHYPQQN